VTDTKTKQGAPDLRVEAWDHEDPGHTLYGSAVADSSGRFDLSATVNVPQVVTKGVLALLKVFQQQQALPATGDTTIKDLFSQTAALSLSVTAQPQAAPVTDKVGVSQLLAAVDFVRLSDFKGVFQEGRDRVSAATSVLGDSLKSAIGSVQIKPIKPSAVRTSDVIHQDPATATQRLQSQGIQVTDTKPYTGDVAGLTTLTSLPLAPKAGQKVELYQQNGVVRAYKIVTDTPPKVDPATFGQLQTNVGNLQAQLNARSAQIDQLSAQLTAKSNQVDQLQTQLNTRSAQVDQMQTQLTTRSAQVDQMQTQLTTKAAQVDQLQAQIATRATQVDQLTTQFTALQQAQTQLATAVKPADIAAIKAKLQIP
jgi:hypothetical protein